MATKKAPRKATARKAPHPTTKVAPADEAPPVAEVGPASLTNAAINTRPLDEDAIQSNYPPAEPPPAGVTSPNA